MARGKLLKFKRGASRQFSEPPETVVVSESSESSEDDLAPSSARPVTRQLESGPSRPIIDIGSTPDGDAPVKEFERFNPNRMGDKLAREEIAALSAQLAPLKVSGQSATKQKQQQQQQQQHDEEDSDSSVDLDAPPIVVPSRRDREAAEKAAATVRYQQRHAEGKTDAAKADLARLAEVRRRREADAARRKAAEELAAKKQEK